jgi:EAL domain-containing protein (putative c-di-GMP-specific phosphodiesterase class I)
MGVRTVAESVEDAATLSALRKMGVDYAQGFGLADPEPLFGRRLDVRQAGVPAAA